VQEYEIQVDKSWERAAGHGHVCSPSVSGECGIDDECSTQSIFVPVDIKRANVEDHTESYSALLLLLPNHSLSSI